MSRRPIQFDHSESKAIWKLLERAANKSHRDRQRVFRDWITMITCALSAKQMEDLYLEVVKQYGDPLTSADQKRDRAVDALHEAFHLPDRSWPGRPLDIESNQPQWSMESRR